MKYFTLLIILCTAFSSAENTSSDFRFVVVGDRTGGTVENVFDEIIDEISLLHPDFVINVGNLISGGTDDTMAIHAQWDTVLNIIDGLPCKFYFVPGSNDIQDEITRAIYEKRTGIKSYYAFDYKNCHFIILDNSTTFWAPLPTADEEQFQWLLEDLEKHKDADHIFVFFHVPGYLNALRTDTPCPLMEALAQYNVRAVFSGSLHSYMYHAEATTDYIVVGSSGGAMEDNDPGKGNFFQYLYVTVNQDEYDVAVIRKGSIFLRNFLTASDYLRIESAQREVVTFPEFIVKEGSKKNKYKCTMLINNIGSDSLKETLTWVYDPSRYTVKPQKLPLLLEWEERKEYQIEVTIPNGSDIFPIPQFALVYPFTFGKACTLKNVLSFKRLKTVKKVKSSPIIDGELNDKLWQDLIPISNLGSNSGQLSPIEKTETYLGHDKENVYIAVRCFESDFYNLSAQTLEHDGPTYADDNVWFFFDSNLDKETYYQLIVNSNGVAFDRSCKITQGQPTTDIEWNGPWDIEAGREDNAWTLEIKIPKHGLKPFDEKQWGFNFRRLQTRLENAAYWTLPFGHDPANFGIIEFD